MEDNNIYAKLNVLGVDLPKDQVDAILDQSNQTDIVCFRREWLSGFFSVKQTELERNYLERYAEADNVMTNISVGSYNDDIHTRLIQSLASAKRCYSYGEYLACIELCALHGEMLVNYLCTSDRTVLESAMDKLSKSDKKHIIDKRSQGPFFADGINQTVRIRWLLSGNIIDDKDKEAVGIIHEMRINYFHRWLPGNENTRRDALSALETITPVSAKYLELLHNECNVSRIKRYMRCV
ncbi:TPA: hypothetical protein JBI62_00850 [Legionella pneumophila]|nr:hypothetical protein [Legionella pneumophila]